MTGVQNRSSVREGSQARTGVKQFGLATSSVNGWRAVKVRVNEVRSECNWKSGERREIWSGCAENVDERSGAGVPDWFG